MRVGEGHDLVIDQSGGNRGRDDVDVAHRGCLSFLRYDPDRSVLLDAVAQVVQQIELIVRVGKQEDQVDRLSGSALPYERSALEQQYPKPIRKVADERDPRIVL